MMIEFVTFCTLLFFSFYYYYFSEDEFMQCMTASQLKPGVAKKMYNVLVKDIEDSLKADFDEMLADGNLDYGLGKLKDVIANATRRQNEIAW